MGLLTRTAALAAAAIILGAIHSQFVRVELTSPAPPPVDEVIARPPGKGPSDTGAQTVVPPQADSPPKFDTPPSQGAAPSKPPAADPRMITLESAKALFDKRDGSVIFIDARELHEFTPSHIQGAMHVPPGAFRGRIPKKVLDNLPYSTLVIYCGGGTCEASENVAAGLTATLGKNAGAIYIFHDGFPAWEKAGFPVESGATDIFDEAGR